MSRIIKRNRMYTNGERHVEVWYNTIHKCWFGHYINCIDITRNSISRTLNYPDEMGLVKFFLGNDVERVNGMERIKLFLDNSERVNEK